MDIKGDKYESLTDSRFFRWGMADALTTGMPQHRFENVRAYVIGFRAGRNMRADEGGRVHDRKWCAS